MEDKIVTPPPPKAKVPLIRKYGGVSPRRLKIARGFSLGEIEKAGLTLEKARKIGVYVDIRRKTIHGVNVKNLEEWLKSIPSKNVRFKPALPKVICSKEKRGRVFKGETSAGRKVRGLVKARLKETHRHKWKKKEKT